MIFCLILSFGFLNAKDDLKKNDDQQKGNIVSNLIKKIIPRRSKESCLLKLGKKLKKIEELKAIQLEANDKFLFNMHLNLAVKWIKQIESSTSFVYEMYRFALKELDSARRIAKKIGFRYLVPESRLSLIEKRHENLQKQWIDLRKLLRKAEIEDKGKIIKTIFDCSEQYLKFLKKNPNIRVDSRNLITALVRYFVQANKLLQRIEIDLLQESENESVDPVKKHKLNFKGDH
ncbi:MAG: hypothetical protein ACTSXG_03740 [Alphaproteobacteria bacterium]